MIITFLSIVCYCASLLIQKHYAFFNHDIEIQHMYHQWILIDELKIDCGTSTDLLTTSMLYIISLISASVLFYSINYMYVEKGVRKNIYFLALIAFIVFMNILVISNNFLSIFIG